VLFEESVGLAAWVRGKFENKLINIVCDTGAGVSIISKKLFEDNYKRHQLKHSRTQVVKVANGHDAKIIFSDGSTAQTYHPGY